MFWICAENSADGSMIAGQCLHS